jgi:transcriptional regulator with XRE-family HTH domain
MPRPTSRKKTALSQAVCDLRAVLGDSQQAFSNRLGVALHTIARYETYRPPSGEALLKLANVAEQHGHLQSRDFFRIHYVDEVFKELGFQVLMVPPTESEPARGYLMSTLRRGSEFGYAQSFLSVLAATRSTDADVSRTANKGFAALERVARECNANPLVDDIHHAFRTAISGERDEDERNTSSRKPAAANRANRKRARK